MNISNETIIKVLIFICFLIIAIWKLKHDFHKISTNKKALKVKIKDRNLSCYHCNCDCFFRREGVINTTMVLFFKLGFLNQSAVCFQCCECGLVCWFSFPKESASVIKTDLSFKNNEKLQKF